jgi:hypothetical protein
MQKYELVNYDKNKNLWQIKALIDIYHKGEKLVKKGELGGFVSGEHNLSHLGSCWVYELAEIHDDARVYEDASVFNSAKLFNHVRIFGNGSAYRSIKIYDYVSIFDRGCAYGDGKITGTKIIDKNNFYCDDSDFNIFEE